MGVARALVALKEETGWSNREIDRPGIISKVYVGRLLALLGEPDFVRARLGVSRKIILPLAPAGSSDQVAKQAKFSLFCLILAWIWRSKPSKVGGFKFWNRLRGGGYRR